MNHIFGFLDLSKRPIPIYSDSRKEFTRFLVRLFLWSVILNYPWEMLQMPLYEGMLFSDPMSWLVCFRASIGDGFIILTIWGFGYLLFRQRTWFQTKNVKNISLLVLSGAVIAIAFEIHALKTGRWVYSDLMPLLPYLGVGLSPLLQLMILPWLAMKLAGKRS